MKTLHLTLRKKWFDLIASGEKTEEYREIKPYWVSRFVDWSNYPKESPNDHKYITQNIVFDIEQGHKWEDVIQSYFSKLKKFDGVIFRNGYSGGAPLVSFRNPVVTIGFGRSEWGAEPGRQYFVIKFPKAHEYTAPQN